MADRYWVGGTNTWNTTASTKWATTSGGAGGAAVPTAADDVYFDAASTGTVTISAATCRSINCTGFTGTLSHSSGVTIAIGDGTAGAGNVALKLVAGMTYTLGNASSSALNFVSTSTTQQTVATGGKVLGNTTWNGAGGSWLLSDNLTATGGTLTLTAGTLNTGGVTIAASLFNSSNSNTRVLTLGASTLTFSSTATAWNTGTVSGITLTANTAVVTLTGNGAGWTAGNLDYNGMSVVFTGSGTKAQTQNPTGLNNVTITGTANKTDTFTTVGFTFTGTFTVTGNSLVNRILVASSVLGTVRTISGPAVSLTNVDFTDINAAGAAAPWTGSSLGDGLGNTNITFTAAVTRYAVAAGNFSSTSVWSTSDGGASGASVPLCHDTVVINGNSGTGTITGDMPRPGASVSFTGYTGTYNLNVAQTVYGSFTLSSGMSLTGSNPLSFTGRGTHTLTSAGKTYPSGATLNFNAVNGSYTLQDALAATNAIFLLAGTLDTNGFTVTIPSFASSTTTNVRTITLGNSTVNLTSTSAATVWNTNAGNLTVNAGTSNIVISTASANLRQFSGSNKTYYSLTYTVAGSTGGLQINNGNTFENINFSDVTNARTLTFPASTTTTITGTFNVVGTSGKLMTINSSTAGTATTIRKLNARIETDYLSVQDITAEGIFYAGVNSTNVSNNTRVIFTTAPRLQDKMMASA